MLKGKYSGRWRRMQTPEQVHLTQCRPQRVKTQEQVHLGHVGHRKKPLPALQLTESNCAFVSESYKSGQRLGFLWSCVFLGKLLNISVPQFPCEMGSQSSSGRNVVRLTCLTNKCGSEFKFRNSRHSLHTLAIPPAMMGHASYTRYSCNPQQT